MPSEEVVHVAANDGGYWHNNAHTHTHDHSHGSGLVVGSACCYPHEYGDGVWMCGVGGWIGEEDSASTTKHRQCQHHQC